MRKVKSKVRIHIRTFRKILTGLLILICITPVAGYVALQFPQLQTRIAHKAVTALQEKIDGKIEVDRVAIVFVNKVMAYGICITGEQGDTLASVEKLSVSISPSDLLRGRIHINRLFLQNGCFNLIKEGPGKYNNINRIFRTAPKPDSLKKPFIMPDMTADEITLRNMAFSLVSPLADTIPVRDDCMNFKNMRLKGIDARINRVKIEDNTVSCRIRDLGCYDRCGYQLQSLSGSFSLDSAESRMDNLHLIDSWSEINAEYLSFGYTSGKDLKDFVNKIVLGADFNRSTLDFRSIGVFAPSLRDNSLKMNLKGGINGTVSDLRTYDLQITSGPDTELHLSAALTGLPDIMDTYFNVTIKNITSSPQSISDIISDFSSKPNGIASVIPDTRISLNGIAYGTIDSLYGIGALSSEAGKVGFEACVRKDNSGNSIQSSLWVENLDLGQFLHSGTLGRTGFNSKINAHLPRKGSDKGISAEIQSMNISSLNINGYEYRDIDIKGSLADSIADVRLISHDRAVPAMFQGVVTLDRNMHPGRIRVFMDVPYADLMAMNLDKKGTMATAGVTASADLRLTDRSVLGNIMLQDISYANNNGQYHIDSIYIRSALSEKRHTVTLQSPILQAGYTSTDSPARLVERLKLAMKTTSTERLLDIDTSRTSGNNGYYNFHLRTFDMSQICDIIMPGLYIADSTTIDISLDENNILKAGLQSSSIAFRNKKGNGYTFDGLAVDADNYSDNVRAALAVGSIRSGGMTVDNTLLSLAGHEDNLRLRLTYNNADTTWLNFSAMIDAWKDRNGKLLADISIDSSGFNIRNHIWELSPAELSIRPREYTVNGLGLYCGDDSLYISGAISENPESILSLSLANFDLDLLNSFTGNSLDLQGKLSGKVDIDNLFSNMGATMELTGDSLSLRGEKLGRLSVLSRRDLPRDRFNLLINNYIEDLNPINISGYFIPGRNYLDLDVTLNQMGMRALSPFLSDFVSVTGGRLSGEIDVTGQPDRLMLSSSNSRIDSLAITPVFTKVPYIINGPITLSNRSIDLDSLTIADPAGSTALLSGSLSHDFFKNIYLDANMTFADFQVLNTQERDNEKFYGNASASGTVTLSGFTDNLLVDAQVSTAGNSSLHVPLSSSSSATTSDLISYTDFRIPADSISKVATESDDTKSKSGKGNIEIRAAATVTQGTELLVEMDKQLGEVLRCTGNGNLNLILNPSRNLFDIRGDYTISEGSYHFVLSIQSRDFIIDEGGTIAFNGDFRNTNLNVGATYRTKASISTLIADTTSVGNRRNVDCGIHLQGPLSNPELSFTIDIPDLDPITKGQVESALSTPDKIQKQFMALLISGSFVPDEQSGIINNSTILYSNASEILSNQFNNIFRQLDIPLDLGLNYQPGGSGGSWGMFDVAVSYQAFNNRLVINGNVGNDETSSNWAGDFDAEIKVDRQGKLRVTLFTRSADSYSNYLDNTQRSGLGITYQDEFDTFGDFWRNIFMSRKRREQYELEILREAEEELEREAAEANIVKEEVLKPKENPMNFLEETGSVEYQEQGSVYYYKEEEENVKAE